MKDHDHDEGASWLADVELADEGPAEEVVAAGCMRGGADFAAGRHSLVGVLAVLLAGATSQEPKALWDAAYAVYPAR